MKYEANEHLVIAYGKNGHAAGIVAECASTDRAKQIAALLNGAELTPRQRFAAMAMQGMLAGDTEGELSRTDIVSLSVGFADHLLTELAKESTDA